MKINKLFFVGLFLLGTSITESVYSQSDPDNYASGKVVRVYSHKYERLLFRIDRKSTHTPECSTAHDGTEWAIKLDNETGKAMLTILMTAAAQGQTVVVAGDRTCDDWSDRQKPRYVMVQY